MNKHVIGSSPAKMEMLQRRLSYQIIKLLFMCAQAGNPGLLIREIGSGIVLKEILIFTVPLSPFEEIFL
jgi:hypothetical protein